MKDQTEILNNKESSVLATDGQVIMQAVLVEIMGLDKSRSKATR